MNHFLIKGLLSLLMIGQAPVEPVCVSIDKYQTPDKQFNVYFFSDVHMGHLQFLHQEQAHFIAAAKEKNAFVIGEDKLHYDGSDQEIKHLINLKRFAIIYDTLLTDKIDHGNVSALANLGLQCSFQSIPFFNVDYRDFESTENLIKKIDPLIYSVINNNNWLGDYHRKQFKINQIDELSMLILLDYFSAKDFPSKTVDIHILHALHDLMQSQNEAQTPPLLIPYEQKKGWLTNSLAEHQNTQNIFVFAGAYHIENVIKASKNYLHASPSFEDQEKFAPYSIKTLKQKIEKYLPNGLLNQHLAQQFIDKHSVNISQFFSLEKQDKFTELQEKQKLLDSSDLESCEKAVEPSKTDAVKHTTP